MPQQLAGEKQKALRTRGEPLSWTPIRKAHFTDRHCVPMVTQSLPFSHGASTAA